MVMKPVGGSVHLRRGTVHKGIVKHLMIGSVPSAFLGVVLLKMLAGGEDFQDHLKVLLGAALLVAASAMTAKALVQASRPDDSLPPDRVTVKPLPTIAIGIAGGLIVGMTSVGSGSLMIVLLLILYPRLETSALVGTDLVQAVPLVASAALGHLLFGDFELALTTSLLLGCIPAVYVGARLSSRAPGHAIRPVLVTVLVASALKLLGVDTAIAAGVGLTLGALTTLVTWRALRRVEAPATVVPEASADVARTTPS
jgi:hypothetical protein